MQTSINRNDGSQPNNFTKVSLPDRNQDAQLIRCIDYNRFFLIPPKNSLLEVIELNLTPKQESKLLASNLYRNFKLCCQ